MAKGKRGSLLGSVGDALDAMIPDGGSTNTNTHISTGIRGGVSADASENGSSNADGTTKSSSGAGASSGGNGATTSSGSFSAGSGGNDYDSAFIRATGSTDSYGGSVAGSAAGGGGVRLVPPRGASTLYTTRGGETFKRMSVFLPMALRERLMRYVDVTPSTDISKTVAEALRLYLNAQGVK